MKHIIRLIRPKHWVKNIFVFLPLFFSGHLLEPMAFMLTTIVFAAFCLTASAIYCINDLIDVEADRRHPVKCKRPIASGKIGIKTAIGITLLLLAGAAFLVSLLSMRVNTGALILFYLMMNIAYSIHLKRYAIADVCIIAFGFVLRILVGGAATGIVISHWLVLVTFLLTLLMAFAKRRDDVVIMLNTGVAPRQNTSRYNLEFINSAIIMAASVTLVCYIMYTISPEVVARIGSNNIYLTTVFVVMGLLRYLQLTFVDGKSGDPTRLMLSDRFMMVDVILWLLSFFVLIYA